MPDCIRMQLLTRSLNADDFRYSARRVQKLFSNCRPIPDPRGGDIDRRAHERDPGQHGGANVPREKVDDRSEHAGGRKAKRAKDARDKGRRAAVVDDEPEIQYEGR